MGRSNGYRPKKAQREEVLEWRYVLSTLTVDDWVKAQFIMNRITSLVGATGGPMGGLIEPRACRYCYYFGHTRHTCEKRKAVLKAIEDREVQAMLDEDHAYAERFKDVVHEPYDATKTGQARTFDKLCMPYTVSPVCGPIVGARGQVHMGKWTFDTHGVVVENTAIKF